MTEMSMATGICTCFAILMAYYTLEEESFTGRKFCGFAFFWPIRKSLFP